MNLWAFDSSKKNIIIRYAVLWIQRLYVIQLFFLALTQITYVIEPIKEHQTAYDVMFTMGLILNNTPAYLVSITAGNICIGLVPCVQHLLHLGFRTAL